VSVIDEVKQRLDIVDVVASYVPDLKKAGRNFKAICPFHAEKTPSFFVFPERQSWHCFGACGTGGDAFSFVMKKEGVDFGEALRILAQKAGVALSPPERSEAQQQSQKLKELNEAAAQYYHHLLLNSSVAQQARDYLARRGVSEKAIEDFQLGFSPPEWEALRGQMARHGYSDSDLLAAGLLVEKEQGGAYDRFRNRLMFPIRSSDGRVMGFGARALDDSLPKYTNSPQTAIFDKSSVLYGVDRARSAIRKEDLAIVVEGYMDVVMAHQHGFSNVVASLGTALTEKQVGAIKKLTRNITLALDADAAGQMAMLRGQEVISQTFSQPSSVAGWTDVRYENPYNARWKVVILPQGKDPDEIIREGPDEWQRLVDGATPVIDYVFQVVASKVDLAELDGKSAAVDQLLPIVSEIKDPVSQAHYLQKLSRLVGVNERDLASALSRVRARSRARQRDPVQPSTLVSSLQAKDPLADYCLSLLVRYPELRRCSEELSADLFPHSESRQLLLAWRECGDCDSIRTKLDPALREYLDSLTAKPLPPMTETQREEAMTDCIYRLRQRWLRDMKAKEEALISDMQCGDAAELDEVQRLALEINVQLRQAFLHKQKRTRSSEVGA